MAFPPFKLINPDDPIVDKLETNVAEIFGYLQSKSIIDGVLLEGVNLSAAQGNLVPHLLQRRPRGYMVVKKSPSVVASASAVTDLGTERLWPFAAPPFGWLIEDGSAISRTTYAELFAKIGTTYGIGDGSTTFNIPDCRGRAPVGKTAAGTGSVLNGTFGSLDFTVSIPAHYHAKGAGADLAVSISPGDLIYRGVVGSANNPVGGGTDFKYETLTTSISGRIGLVTGGVDGNAAMTSGSANAPSFVRNWIMKASSAAAFTSIDVWDVDPAANLVERFLQLYSTIDVTVSLWVF